MTETHTCTAGPLATRLAALVRDDRRRRLARALAGTSQDRWDYAVGRQLALIQTSLLAFGMVAYDTREAALRIRRNFYRLEAMARARQGTSPRTKEALR